MTKGPIASSPGIANTSSPTTTGSCGPTDGIVPTLRQLAAEGHPMAIVTSKSDWLAAARWSSWESPIYSP